MNTLVVPRRLQVATISTADVRHLHYLGRDALNGALDCNALAFLADVRKDRPAEPPCVRQTDTLLTAMMLMTTLHVHRVYIVNEASVPVGVCSLTDVLRVLAPPALTAAPLA